MNKTLILSALGFMILLAAAAFWVQIKPYYSPAVAQTGQHVISRHADDTLRITLLGDSWADFHKSFPCTIDTLVQAAIHRPVRTMIAGISGLTSKNIYYSLFCEDSVRSGILWGPDYCLVMAGINDADRKMGRGYYKENMRLLIGYLLESHIKPIVLEIPDFDPATSYRIRPRVIKLRYLFSMLVTWSPMNCIAEYRSALRELIVEQGWDGKVLLLSAASWNADGYRDARDLYDEHRMHLNAAGYQCLDAAVARLIIDDMYR